MNQITQNDETLEAFAVFDRNGDGLISAAEFQHLQNNLGDPITLEQAAEAIRGVDKDGDGHISFEEFSELVNDR